MGCITSDVRGNLRNMLTYKNGSKIVDQNKGQFIYESYQIKRRES